MRCFRRDFMLTDNIKVQLNDLAKITRDLFVLVSLASDKAEAFSDIELNLTQEDLEQYWPGSSVADITTLLFFIGEMVNLKNSANGAYRKAARKIALQYR